ncbi:MULTISPECIES: hypothetical protein [Bacteroides]|uniref:hypothetical protein n=2 Tax=Bacteroides TaxID=816 RepID=UPI001E3014D4|nr:hypothetical protein [Bacteroides fragilis]MCS2780020.1 hypothetical protein [Bacteroides fragilis]MDA1472942.1 hypothetical protein [Bacteroides fragilis]MDK2386863.1 hypothetical protein [Bacteroides fragilis]
MKQKAKNMYATISADIVSSTSLSASKAIELKQRNYATCFKINSEKYKQLVITKDTAKTEYVLAGTFLNFGIALLCELLAAK